VTVPVPVVGIRSYLAVNGTIEADTAFGSVAPDALFGIGRWLRADDEVRIDTRYAGPTEADAFSGIFRLGAEAVASAASPTIDVTAGPDLPRLSDDASWLQAEYTVAPQSDAVGLRLSGPSIEQNTTAEILSRGVPVGAVEVPPSSGLLVLLRARLLTAGYPVIAVVTTDALDRLGQVGPGTVIRFALCEVASVRERLLAHEAQRDRLAGRVGRAMAASGLGMSIDPAHRSRQS
jgi:allophanate hydrolase subunit 2